MISHLPADWRDGLWLGRVLLAAGPTPILVEDGQAFDMSRIAPTVSELIEGGLLSGQLGEQLGPLEQLLQGESGFAGAIRLLAPIDLQVIKACGVTFAISAFERVVEEAARGNAADAVAIRERLAEKVGAEIGSVKPGSAAADKLKQALIAEGLWSQYLEVAIGPDAEVFTKAPVLSAVGDGDHIGLRADSSWNNPEPEVVLVVDSRGQVKGATLGNDVNLRDIEGRSALLLGKAKDNNASCAIGPLIRLFDDGFTIDDLRAADIKLDLVGLDGFTMSGSSSMRLISRDPLELVQQVIGPEHQYPDGFALFVGTMFAPVKDRNIPGAGFTHAEGDVVRISSERLGTLENSVTSCAMAAPWTFGISALMKNLASRGLLNGK